MYLYVSKNQKHFLHLSLPIRCMTFMLRFKMYYVDVCVSKCYVQEPQKILFRGGDQGSCFFIGNSLHCGGRI